MTTTTGPRRIQRKRTAGWRMPPNTTYVGRNGGTLRWGNPYRAGYNVPPQWVWIPFRFSWGDRGIWRPYGGGRIHVTDAQHAVDLYAALTARQPEFRYDARQHLAGRDLVCWCPTDRPCHADVLLAIANGGQP